MVNLNTALKAERKIENTLEKAIDSEKDPTNDAEKDLKDMMHTAENIAVTAVTGWGKNLDHTINKGEDIIL